MSISADRSPPRSGRRAWRGLAALLFGLLGGLALAEASVRLGWWQPAVQIVRGYGLHTVDGVPVWEQSADRHNRACVERHPERLRVLFFGSSITYGVGLTAAEAFTTALQERLNARRPEPGVCVLNFAQPGFAFQQKLVVARAEVARYRPQLILWEDWVEWGEYRMIDDAAYGIHDLRVRADGTVGLRGVPDALNRILFRHSRLYEYLALAFGERVVTPPGAPNPLRAFAETELGKVVELAASVDAALVFYLAPPLDRPFADTIADPPEWHPPILAFARARNVPAYTLQEALRDADVEAVRLDPCCHFNAAGHRALVPVMEGIVLTHLDR